MSYLFQILSNEDILQLLKISPQSRLFKKMVKYIFYICNYHLHGVSSLNPI